MRTWLQLCEYGIVFLGCAYLFCFLPNSSYGQAGVYPLGQKTDLSRYETIWRVSPFVAITDVSGQADNLAGRYVLTGFAKIGDREVVYIFDRTTLERFSLQMGQMKNGITMEGLQHFGNLASARVTIRNGDRTVELRYDPSALPDGGGQVQGAVRVTPQQTNAPVYSHSPQGGINNPNQTMPPWYPPDIPPGLPPDHPLVIKAMQKIRRMPHAIRGTNTPQEARPTSEEEQPQPRRIIRRRAIVVPQ